MKFIYKICPTDVWVNAKKVGLFNGYGIDFIDGFIHFSSLKQVNSTLRLHFYGLTDLCLLKVSTKNLDIKWEKARSGMLFPHLYSSFKIDSVVEVKKIKLDDFGYIKLSNLE